MTKMISCVRCSFLLLFGITYCCSALSPLLTTTTSTKSILTKHNNHKTKLNLSSSSGSSFYPPEPPQQQQKQTPTQQQRWTEYTTTTTTPSTPTQIQQHHPPQDQIQPSPKIVLFGATGKIGRRILKKLLSAPLDIEIVAFVRNPSRLEEVLYHEEDLVLGNLLDKEKKSGAKLTVVVGDVVADTDVYQGKFETGRETEVLDGWVARAQDFFRVKGWNDNNNNNNSSNSTSSGASASGAIINSLQEDDQIKEDVRIIEAGDEALQEAVSGATIIISCLSSLRYSNLWTDYVKVPLLRVFRQDASKWCVDNTHPYYINYLSTKKILEVAEREQLKRDAYNEFERERLLLEEQIERGRKMIMDGEEEEGFESEIAAGLRKKRGTRQRQQHLVAGEDAVDLPKYGITPSSTDRIKFIRISHSMVGRNPFRLVSILTNVLRSQVTRFEFLGEQLLSKSRLIDTIILRPGEEVTDIERDSNSTSLQLCIDGDVPSPNLGLVGRDDIADLAVVAALTKTSLDDDELSFSTAPTTNNATDDSTQEVESTGNISNRPHHYTWSLRWTGGNGSESSALCFVKAIKNEMKLSRIRKMKEKRLTQYHLGAQLLSIRRWMRRTRPHALSVALTVYVALGATAWYFFGSTILDLALRARRHNLLQRFLPL